LSKTAAYKTSVLWKIFNQETFGYCEEASSTLNFANITEIIKCPHKKVYEKLSSVRPELAS